MQKILKSKLFRVLICILLLSVTVLYTVLSGSVHIDDEMVPLGKKKVTAEYYINRTSLPSETSTYLSCQYVGRGTVFETEAKRKNVNMDDVVADVPMINSIDDKHEVKWVRVYYAMFSYRVIGELVEKKVLTDPLEKDTNEEVVQEENPEEVEVIIFPEGIGETSEVTKSAIDESPIEAITFSDTYGEEVERLADSISCEKIMYFSAKGDDANSGLTPTQPKKDPRSYMAAGNCKVLLKSGEIFTIPKEYRIGSNVIVSTYGGTERAVVTTLTENEATFNVYDGANSIYAIKLNEGIRDIGVLKCEGDSDFNWKKKLRNDLVADGEYYIDSEEGVLYMKSMRVLTGKKCSYTLACRAFSVENGSNAVIQNLEIDGAGFHGIGVSMYSNLVIRNCYIHNIGGGIQSTTGVKYGNGIQIWANKASNCYVYGNLVTDVFDAGLTAQISNPLSSASDNLIFANNVVERCNYDFEFFQHSNSAKVSNVVVCDNFFKDALDITGGYRLTQSSTNYTALVCLWYSDNPETGVTFKNNICVGSQKYAVSYHEKKTADVYRFENNTFVVGEDAATVKNPNNHTGDASEFKQLAVYGTDYAWYDAIVKEKADILLGR